MLRIRVLLYSWRRRLKKVGLIFSSLRLAFYFFKIRPAGRWQKKINLCKWDGKLSRNLAYFYKRSLYERGNCLSLRDTVKVKINMHICLEHRRKVLEESSTLALCFETHPHHELSLIHSAHVKGWLNICSHQVWSCWMSEARSRENTPASDRFAWCLGLIEILLSYEEAQILIKTVMQF